MGVIILQIFVSHLASSVSIITLFRPPLLHTTILISYPPK